MAKLREECGVVGVFGDSDASRLIYLALYALQHRGQEACGIVTLNDDSRFQSYKSFGLVGDVFKQKELDSLVGSSGIGHVRYSTHGGATTRNIQPFSFNSSLGPIAVAHNGTLTNATQLRAQLEQEGSIFQSTSDTEIFMHLLAKSREGRLLDRISEVTRTVRGAYSLVLLSQDRLFAVRDPFGFRPLVIGRKGSTYVVASETCALDLLDATFEREVAPGEIVEISESGMTSHIANGEKAKSAFCSFEPIYFSRPDSFIFNQRVYETRLRLGRQLARESSVEADVVIAVPDSGVPMAIGYAEQSAIPYGLGLVRNHYVGRTFIQPIQEIRDFGVKLKLNPVESVLRGKRVIVVDDSLVRGTTSTKILRMIRNAGAAEIHMRIASPPITHSCYFGVDTPERERLLAAQKNVKDMCSFIGSDSLAFLSQSGLKEALASEGEQSYCYGCFSGHYPEETFATIAPQPTDLDGPGTSSL